MISLLRTACVSFYCLINCQVACKRLANKATQLHNTFEDHQDQLKESELRKYTDEVQRYFAVKLRPLRILTGRPVPLRRSIQEPDAGPHTADFLPSVSLLPAGSKGLLKIRSVNDNKIADGIKKCEVELETVLESFTVSIVREFDDFGSPDLA